MRLPRELDISSKYLFLIVTLLLSQGHSYTLATHQVIQQKADNAHAFPWSLMRPDIHVRSKKSIISKRTNTHDDSPTYISDCVQVISRPGTYVVRPGIGSNRSCGVYVAAGHNEVITIDFSIVDVSCRKDGVVVFFDGWEMNGRMFPSIDDHILALPQRVVEMCKERMPARHKLRLRSSQNAAIIQYRIPVKDEGFIFRVSVEENPDPCNILMTEDELITLSNAGRTRNCSLTNILFPVNLKLFQFQIGEPRTQVGMVSPCTSGDYVNFGGSSHLDPSDLDVYESVCGREPDPAKMGLTVLCESSTVRLVSSGNYENSITVFAKEAEEKDLDYEKNIIMICPNYAIQAAKKKWAEPVETKKQVYDFSSFIILQK